MFQISYFCKSFLFLFDFTKHILCKKNKKKNIGNNVKKNEILMNIFNYITLKHKRNEQLSYN